MGKDTRRARLDACAPPEYERPLCAEDRMRLYGESHDDLAAIRKPRLRVLELPKQTLGEACDTPFILVFDRCGDSMDLFGDIEDVAKRCGARSILAFADEIQLGDAE